jgi:hypothetical protein
MKNRIYASYLVCVLVEEALENNVEIRSGAEELEQ